MEEPAADHLATIDWQRGAWSDKKGKYSRQHTWVLAGTRLKASEIGAVTPAAYHDKTPIDPYNMFVATVASAHMLTWLHMAFSIDIEVDRYVDRAYGVLTGPSERRLLDQRGDPAPEGYAQDRLRDDGGNDGSPARACAGALLHRTLD